MENRLNKKYMEKVSVIIPAFNEEKKIAETINSIKTIDCISEIIVVDDGSNDRTKEIAEKYDVKVMRNKKNLGKGKSLQKGLDNSIGNIVVFLDADLGSSACEAEKLIKPILTGNCDMTIGNLGAPLIKGGFGIVKTISRLGVKCITGVYLKCVLSGQRAFKREVLNGIIISNRYGAEVGITIDVLKRNYEIKEIDVNMKHNETDRSLKGFIHRGRQCIDIVNTLLEKVNVRMY